MHIPKEKRQTQTWNLAQKKYQWDPKKFTLAAFFIMLDDVNSLVHATLHPFYLHFFSGRSPKQAYDSFGEPGIDLKPGLCDLNIAT